MNITVVAFSASDATAEARRIASERGIEPARLGEPVRTPIQKKNLPGKPHLWKVAVAE